MALKFRINEIALKQIKATVKEYGVCWVNGCGNFYADEKSSMDKKAFTNPDQEEATYVVKFTKEEDVPSTVEKMEKLFWASRQAETQQTEDSRSNVVKSVRVEETVKTDLNEENKKKKFNS